MSSNTPRTVPIIVGFGLCFFLFCPILYYFTLYNAKMATRSRTESHVLVERSLRQFGAAQIAAAHFRATNDPEYAEQVSENLRKADEILNEISLSDFDFRHKAIARLTMGTYFRFGGNFRFAAAIQRESIGPLDAEWKKIWEASLVSLDSVISLLEKDEAERFRDTEQPLQENSYLAEIRQIREETFRLALRQHDITSPNKELADELLRDIEQRCEKSIEWLEKFGEQVVTEEIQKSVTDAINMHKWLKGMSSELSRMYAAQRNRWEELDSIVAQAEEFGNELFQSRNR